MTDGDLTADDIDRIWTAATVIVVTAVVLLVVYVWRKRR